MHSNKVFDGFSHRGIWLSTKFCLRFFHFLLKSVRACLQRLTPSDSLHIFSGTCTISSTNKKKNCFIASLHCCGRSLFLNWIFVWMPVLMSSCPRATHQTKRKEGKQISSNVQIIKAKKLPQISFYIPTFRANVLYVYVMFIKSLFASRCYANHGIIGGRFKMWPKCVARKEFLLLLSNHLDET